MSAVWFLVGAVALSLIGSTIVALWHRQPKVRDAGIDEFAARMEALAPPSDRWER